MDRNLSRQVTFHLLSAYEGLDPEWDFRQVRTGAITLTVMMTSGEKIWDGAVRALQSEPNARTDWLLTQVHEDAAHLRGLKREAPQAHWLEEVHEEYLIYSLDDDGNLRIHMWRDHRSMTIANVDDVTEARYIDVKPNHFVIHGPEGRGGDFGTYDMAAWLLQQGVDIAVPLVRDGLILWLLAKCRRRIRNSRTDRKARAFARAWKHRSIEAPFQLRQFLDTKDEWSVAEVDRRLFSERSPETSRQLLRALGYLPDAGGTWSLGSSRRSIKLRKSWEIAEARDLGADGSTAWARTRSRRLLRFATFRRSNHDE